MRLFGGDVPAAGTYTYELGVTGRLKTYSSLQARLVYGAGGTSIKVFLQTSLDNRATWRDVSCLAFLLVSADKASFTTGAVASAPAVAASDGALADDTIQQGMFGRHWRVKVVIVGTYTTSQIYIDADVLSGLD